MIGQIVCPRALDVLVLKAADAIQSRLVQPVQQGLEFGLGLAGIADDEGGSQGDLGADRAPGRDLVQRLRRRRRPGHAAQHVRMRVLEGNVQIGQHPSFGHQRDQVAHMRIGIDIMQPHPCPQRAKVAGQIGDMGAVAAFLGMAAVKAVGAGVLADDQKLADPGLDQPFGLADHRMGRAADQAAAHVGDDAELALMVTAL